MIKSVSIARLRGIKQGRIEGLTPLTIVVGPNGTGKSTILDALLLATSSDPGDALGRAVRRRRELRNGVRWIFWRAGEEGPANVEVEPGPRRCEINWEPPGSSKRQETEGSQTLGCTIEAPELLLDTKTTPMGVDLVTKTTMRKRVWSVTFDVQDWGKYETHSPHDPPPHGWAPFVKLIDSGTVYLPPLDRTYSRVAERGQGQTAWDLVATVVPGAKRLEILSDLQTGEPVLHFVWDTHSVPVALSGDGVRALVRLVLELAMPANSLALVEEPELHQHPGAIVQSARALLAAVGRGVQIVLTTHSLELIDAILTEAKELSPLSLHRVLLKDGALKTSRLSGDEIALSRGEIADDLR